MYPDIPMVLEADAILPTRGTPDSAGLDLYAQEDTLVTEKQCLVKTGVKMAIPKGCVGIIKSRSGLAAKYGVFTEAGVIDADFTQSVCVVMYCNKGEYQIKKGDRIAQLLIQPICLMNPVQVDFLQETSRTGGFGSTGK